MNKLKSLLLLPLSIFAFGQNVELIQKFNSGDETTPLFFSEQIIPDYKLVKSKRIDSRFGDEMYFVYLPKNTSESDVLKYNSGGVNAEAVTLSYKINNSFYKFGSIKGKCNIILPFWTKEIKPDTKIIAGQRDSFIYENKELKVKYFMTATETDYKSCHFSSVK